MSSDDDPIESAPEGANCAVHPERSALVTCPRCGNYCCIACWHGSVRRCHACLLRDPPTPPAWADHHRSFPSRFFGTLADAFRPAKSAPTFAAGHWRQAISFALLTVIPLGILAGIVPFTHTLRFGPTWAISFIGAAPTSTELALDLAQAAALGLLMTAVKLALLAAPYLSLTTAYGQASDGSPPRQVLLYRAWLIPLGGHTGLFVMLAAWASALEPSDNFMLLAQIAALLPMMIVLWSMTASARIAGVGPFASMVVVLIPFIVMFLVEPLVMEALSPVLPDSETIRQGVVAAGR